jgi:predicted O-methyltransferase YrrM
MIYIDKYLKYKQKYLNLKNKNEIIYQSTTGFPVVIKNNNSIYITSSKDLNAIQSSIDVNNPYISNNKYEYFMLSGILINYEKIQNYLLIGLGGGFTAKLILKLLPNIELDIVEFNREMVYVAQKYFNFKPSNKTTINITDGIEYIMNLNLMKHYNVISLDAFDEFGNIPSGFLKNKFIKKIRKHLTQNGLLIINSIDDSVIVKKLLEQNFNYYICITISYDDKVNDIDTYNDLMNDKCNKYTNYIFIASMNDCLSMNSIRSDERVTLGIRSDERVTLGIRSDERVTLGIRSDERVTLGIRSDERVTLGNDDIKNNDINLPINEMYNGLIGAIYRKY